MSRTISVSAGQATTTTPPGASTPLAEPREATTGLERYRAAMQRLDCAAAHVDHEAQDAVYGDLAAHLDAVTELVPVRVPIQRVPAGQRHS